MTSTTKLDAVNLMLETIGAEPVNQLTRPTSQDVMVACRVLDEVTKETQAEEFYFNTEDNFVLSPDSDGFIYLPDNITRVRYISGASDTFYITKVGGTQNYLDLSIRGNRLYDKTNHTFTFSGPIVASITLCLNFEELPLEARTYISIKAARRFAVNTMGDEALERWTAADEQKARNNMIAADTRQANARVGGLSYIDPLVAVELSRY